MTRNLRIETLGEAVRSSYWFVPTLMAIAAVVGAIVCLEADKAKSYNALQQSGIVFSGGPEGARAVLSAIATSVITVAGTIFSITIASLSLTSAQFGPRLLRSFMRDRGNQVVLGTFVATFLYCLLVLRTIQGPNDRTVVPHISVTVGVVFAVSSLAVLIYFIHHVTQSIQVSHVVEVAGAELDGAIRRLFPEPADMAAPPASDPELSGEPVRADCSGYIEGIDIEALVEVASSCGATLAVVSAPGEYAIPGMPLVLADPRLDDKAVHRIRRAFALGRRRTPRQDPAFAFLQVADIALRALSPSLNDPLTACMCLDRITSALCLLAERSLPERVRTGSSGRGRVVACPYRYRDMVVAGYRHIAEAARDQPMVRHRCRTCIQLVLERQVPPELGDALHRELDLLDPAPDRDCPSS